MIFLVVFEADPKGQSYAMISQKLRNHPNSYHSFGTTWFVADKEMKNATQLYDELIPLLDKNDSLFVTPVSRNFAGYIRGDNTDWLEANL